MHSIDKTSVGVGVRPHFEALEPRVLLSADGMLPAPESPADYGQFLIHRSLLAESIEFDRFGARNRAQTAGLFFGVGRGFLEGEGGAADLGAFPSIGTVDSGSRGASDRQNRGPQINRDTGDASFAFPRGLPGASSGGTTIPDIDRVVANDAPVPVDGTNPTPPARAADLVVSASSVGSEARSGEPTLLQWTITNSGTDDARGTGWRDDAWFSRDATLGNEGDIYLGSWWSGPYLPLATGQSYSQARYVTLPEEAIGDGFLIIAANHGGRLAERAGNNNTLATALRVVRGAPVEPGATPVGLDLLPGAAATLSAAEAQAIAIGLRGLADWASDVSATGALGTGIVRLSALGAPDARLSLGELTGSSPTGLGLGEFISTRIAAPFEAFIVGTPTPTTQQVIDLLRSLSGATSAEGGLYDAGAGDELAFEVSIVGAGTPQNVELDLSGTASSPAIDVAGSVTLASTATVSGTLIFGLDRGAVVGGSPTSEWAPQAFFVRAPSTLSVQVAATGAINTPLALGFFDAQVTNGSATLSAGVTVSTLNISANPRGNVTLGELEGTSVVSAVSMGTLPSPLTITLPVSGSIGSYTVQATGQSATLTLSLANVLTTPTAGAYAAANFNTDVELFSNINARQALGLLNDLAANLTVLGRAGGLSPDLRFAQGLSAGNVADYGLALADSAFTSLEPVAGTLGFTGFQSMIGAIAGSLGVSSSSLVPSYNTATNELTFTIDFSDAQTGPAAALAIGSELLPLNALAATGTVATSSVTGGLLRLGLDLTALGAGAPAFTALALLSALNGSRGVRGTQPYNTVNAEGDTVVREPTGLAQFRLETRAGTAFDLNISGATTVGDVLTLIQVGTAGAVVASIDPAAYGLVLTDTTSGGGVFRVSVLNGSAAATDLGIFGTDEDGDGVLAGAALHGQTLAQRFFLRDATLGADITVSGSGFTDVDARLGLLEINATSASLTSTTNVDALLAGTVNLEELTSALSDDASILGTPTVVRGATFTLSGVTVDGNFVTGVGAGATVTVTSADLSNPAAGTASFNAAGTPLQSFARFSRADLTSLFDGVAAFLRTSFADARFNERLPVVGVSLLELLANDSQVQGQPATGFLDQLEQAFDAAAADEGLSVQALEVLLDNALGSLSAADVTYSSGTSTLSIDIDRIFTYNKMLSYYVDLGVLGIAAADSIAETQSTSVTAIASADVSLRMGVDLSAPSTPVLFLRDTSDVTANVVASMTDASFTATLGPAGVVVGSPNPAAPAADKAQATLGLSTNQSSPAIFRVSLVTGTNGRHVVSTLDAGDAVVFIDGATNASMPLFYYEPILGQLQPILQSGSQLVHAVTDLGNVGGSTGALGADISAFISAFNTDFGDNLNGIVDGLQTYVNTADSFLSDHVFNSNLPLIGPALADVADFFADVRAAIAVLASDARSGVIDVITLRTRLFSQLGPGGRNVLRDEFGQFNAVGADGVIDLNDVSITIAPIGQTPRIQVEFAFGGTRVITQPIGFDLGLPSIGFDLDAEVELTIDYAAWFTFGLDSVDGFYVDTSRENELFLTLTATTPGLQATGTLGFLQATATDNTETPTQLVASFNVDLSVPGDRITLGNFSELEPSEIFVPTLTGGAFINYDLVLGIAPGVAGANSTASFPSIETNFRVEWVLDWDFDPGSPVGESPVLYFNDVRLNAGQFLSRFAEPVVTRVVSVLEPIRPILELLVTPIPVISEGFGAPTSLIDLAERFNGPKAQTQFIQAFAGIVRILTTPGIFGTGSSGYFINFGSFNVGGGSGTGPDGPYIDLRDARNLSNVNPDMSNAADVAAQNTSPLNPASTLVTRTAALEGGGFRFPIIQSPAEVFKLLLGQNASFFEYTTPRLVLGFGFEKTIPIYGPLSARLAAGFDISAQLTFGFDTFGMRRFQQTGFDPNQIGKLFDGFYVSDVDADGVDVPEVTLEGRVTLAALLGINFSVATAEAGVRGGIYATIDGNLYGEYDDGDNDPTRIRAEAIQLLGPEIIEFTGELTAKVDAFIKVEVDAGFFTYTVYDRSWVLASITLIKFEFGGPPETATQNGSTLTLNTSGYDRFNVNQESDGSLTVFARKRTQNFTGVTTLVLNGDSDDEFLSVQARGGGSATVNVTFNGNDGNDALLYTGTGIVNATGGAGEDTLNGGLAADIISGGAGNDLIYGKAGNDRLQGDEDDDTIDAGSGNDYLVGGAGNDTLLGGEGSDILFGDTPPADFSNRSGFVLTGGLAQIPTGASPSAVAAGGANPGNDSLDGGPDGSTDWLFGQAGNDEMDAGAGADYLDASAGTNIVRGGLGNDRIFTGGGNSFITGGQGNDTISAGDGANEIYGGTNETGGSTNSGNDTITSGSGTDTINAGDGNDTINSGGGSDRVIGGLGSDTIDAGAGDDTVFAGLEGSTGDNAANTISGGDGADTLIGDAGNDTIYGHSLGYVGSLDGNDIIQGAAGNDTIFGYSGNDTISGDEGDDSIFGGTGDDELSGDAGNDVIFGGDQPAGFNRADYLTVAGRPVAPAALATGFAGVAGDGIDIIKGGDNTDWLFGGGASDQIAGDAGNDYIDGGDANDDLRGGAGSDTILAGNGNDNAFAGFSAFGGGVAGDLGTILGGSGIDRLYGDNGNDTISGEAGTDILIGGRGNDTLDGGADADQLFTGLDISGGGSAADVNTARGGTGNDIIYGDVGADTLEGNDGEDSLSALAGNDFLYGGAGIDRLEGGAGVDQLFGGSEADLLVVYTLLTTSVAGLVFDGNGPQDDAGTPSPRTHADDTDVLLINGTASNDVITIGKFPGSGANDPRVRITIGGLFIDANWRSTSSNAANRTPWIEQFQIDLAGGNNIARFITGADALDVSLLNARSATSLVSIIYGGPQSDVIVGSGGRDMIVGGFGNDFIFGAGGDDRLWGDTSTNIANIAEGNDFIYSGAGNDDVLSQGGNDTVFAGTRTVETNLINNASILLTGNLAGLDMIGANDPADQGLNRIHAGTGNDALYGGYGVDFMYGGDNPAAETDALYDRNNDRFVDASVDPDWVEYARDLERVWYFEGTDQTDNIRLDYVTDGAFANTHVISRQTGAFYEIVFNFSINALDPDTLQPEWTTPDQVLGQTSGVDAFSAYFQTLINGEADFDVIIISARGGDDQIVVNPNVRKTVWTDGGSGNDSINHMDLPPGVTPIFDSNVLRRDVIVGGSGDDVLSGSVGEDWIFGGTGRDTLTGGLDGGRFDLLFGEGGDDVFQIIPDSDQAFPEADQFFGGAGIDQALYYGSYTRADGRPASGVRDFVTVGWVAPLGLASGYYTVGALVRDQSFNPTSTDFLRTTASGDFVQRITRFNTQGTEHLVIDTLDGNDWVYLNPQQLSTQYPNFEFTRQWGLDREARAEGANIPSIQVRGGDGNDLIFGSDLADNLYGEGGDDYINGFAGDDFISGDTGSDFLVGERITDSNGNTSGSLTNLPSVPAPFILPTVQTPSRVFVETAERRVFQYAVSAWDPAFIAPLGPAVAQVPESSFSPGANVPITLLADPAGSFLTREGNSATNGLATFDGTQTGYNRDQFTVGVANPERWFTFTTQGDGSATAPGFNAFDSDRGSNFIRLSPDSFSRTIRAGVLGGWTQTAANSGPTAAIDFGNRGASADQFAQILVDLSTLVGDEDAFTSATLNLSIQRFSTVAATLQLFALAQEPNWAIATALHSAATSPSGSTTPVATANIGTGTINSTFTLNLDITSAVRTALESGRNRLALRLQEVTTTAGDFSILALGRSGAANTSFVTLNSGRPGIVADLWRSDQSSPSDAPIRTGVSVIDMRELRAGTYYMRVRSPVPVIRGPVFNPTTGSTYYALQSTDWQTALGWARQLGGDLATINNAAENTFIVNTLNDWGVNNAYIGLNDIAIENTFVWSSGSTATYRNWNATEPNNFNNNEDVAFIQRSDGTWFDANAASSFVALVETSTPVATSTRFEIEIAPPSRFHAQPATFNDTIVGGEGSDTLIGGPGTDTIRGGNSGAADGTNNTFIAELTEAADFQPALDRGPFIPTVSEELTRFQPAPLNPVVALTSQTVADALGLLRAQANAEILRPAISDDGNWIAFATAASNLVAQDIDAFRDVYVMNVNTGAIELVSVSTAEVKGNEDSGIDDVSDTSVTTAPYNISISADGRFVAFATQARNLWGATTVAAAGTGGNGTVVLRDRQAGTTTLVTRTTDGNPFITNNSGSSGDQLRGFVMSSNGRYVVFSGHTPGTSGPDFTVTNYDAPQIYAYDRLSNTITLAVRDINGNALAYGPNNNGQSSIGSDELRAWSVSADGRFIAFTTAHEVVFDPDTINTGSNLLYESAIYVMDRDTDADGFFDEAGAVRPEIISSDQPRFANSNVDDSSYTQPSISANGRYVVYRRNDGEWISQDSNGSFERHVYIRDRQIASFGISNSPWPNDFNGGIRRVSLNPDGTHSEASADQFYNPIVSNDGRWVAFTGLSDAIIPGTTVDAGGLYLRDMTLQTNAVTFVFDLLNVDLATTFPTATSDLRVIAADSAIASLVPDDSNAVADAFLFTRPSVSNPAGTLRLPRSITPITESALASIQRLDLSFRNIRLDLTALGASNELADLSMFTSLRNLSLVGNTAPATSVLSGPIVNPANGHIYYVLPAQTWASAQAAARALGGDLVTINDAAENAWLLSTFSSVAAPNDGYWIGLNDVAVEGTYVWSNGETASYRNWAVNQPDNFNNEDYVHSLGPTNGTPGRWNDRPDSALIPAVVEIDNLTDAYRLLDLAELPLHTLSLGLNPLLPIVDGANPTLPNIRTLRALDIDGINRAGQTTLDLAAIGLTPARTVAGNVPIFNPETGHFYIALTNTQSWASAQAAAAALGGYLVTINNQAENTFILDTFAGPAALDAKVWIGLSSTVAGNIAGYRWTNNDSSAYRNFVVGTPFGHPGASGVYMHSDNVTPVFIGQWENENAGANEQHLAVVEFDGPPSAYGVRYLSAANLGVTSLALGTHPGIQTLDVAGNAITSVNSSISTLPNLAVVNVQNNPLNAASLSTHIPALQARNPAVGVFYNTDVLAPRLRDFGFVQPDGSIGSNLTAQSSGAQLALEFDQPIFGIAAHMAINGGTVPFTAAGFGTNRIVLTLTDLAVQGNYTLGFAPSGLRDEAGNAFTPASQTFAHFTGAPLPQLLNIPGTAFPVLIRNELFVRWNVPAGVSIDVNTVTTGDVIITRADGSPIPGVAVILVTPQDPEGDQFGQDNATYTLSAALPNGSYRVTATAGAVSTTAGIASLAADLGVFTIDSVAPTGALATLSNQIVPTLGSPPRIRVQWSDVGTSIDPATLGTNDITISGVTITAFNHLGNGLVEYTLNQNPADGVVTVNAVASSVRDLAGNAVAAGIIGSFQLDRSIPTGTLIGPAAGSILSASPGFVDVRWNDTRLDLAGTINTGNITIAGVTIDRVVYLNTTIYRYFYADDGQTLADGVHTVTIPNTNARVADTAGNRAVAGPLGSFTIDSVGPTAAVTAPNANNFILPGTTTTFTVTWNDPSGTGINHSTINGNEIQVTVNGVVQTILSAVRVGATNSYTYTLAQPLPAGTVEFRTIAGNAADLAGNAITSAFIAAWTSSSALSLPALASPVNGAIINSASPTSLTVTFGSSNTAPISYPGLGQLRLRFLVNGVAPTSVTRSVNVVTLNFAPLPEGNIVVELVGTPLLDIFNRQIPLGVIGSFRIDRTAPTATLDNPLAGATQDADLGFVDVRWNDAGAGIDPASLTPASITIAGVSIDRVEALGNGVFRYFYADDGDRLTSGTVQIMAVAGAARDLAGNAAAGNLIGSFIINVPVPGPTVTNFRINNGVASRSGIATLDVTFDRGTNLASLVGSGVIAQAVQLWTTTGTPALVTLAASRFRWSDATNTLTIDLTTDAFGPLGATILANDRYELRLDSALIVDSRGDALRTALPTDRYLTLTRSTGAATADFFRLLGDADGNGTVTFLDITTILANFGNMGTAGTLFADTNGDGAITFLDLTTVLSNFGTTI